MEIRKTWKENIESEDKSDKNKNETYIIIILFDFLLILSDFKPIFIHKMKA